MTLVEPRAVVHLPTLAKTLFDVTGAGDTVAAAFALALAAGRSLHEAARLANHAGGLAVGKPRTAPVSLAELAAALPPWPEAKSVTRAELVGHLARLRAEGRRIVFTNGCFDLLHRGHVSLLARAKELGDVLVVGVNTDASVRRLKGAPRPLTSEDDRVAVLAAVGCVDFVVLFDEETPYELIQAVAPDVLVKGGDYRPEEIVGRDIVPETVVMPLVEGYSTTGIVGRLAAPP
jgi:D-beta-D-heptose 7-phosphate kinase / D-beta-D-heptose 1-phosphate adenosyltransferase